MVNGMVQDYTQIFQLKEVARVSDVLLALPSTRRSRRREILAELSRHHVHVRSLPIERRPYGNPPNGSDQGVSWRSGPSDRGVQ